jgi:DNA-binding MarR family transcriptional regulator
MRKVNRAVTQFFDEYLEPTGIRITQYTLLVEIASSEVKTLSEIAANLIMDRTTLTRNLKPLQKSGYITNAKTNDRRSKSYVLTEKGHKVMEEATPLWQEAQDKIMHSFGNHEYKALCEELEKMLKVTSTHKSKKNN